jgi:hypothetical protein
MPNISMIHLDKGSDDLFKVPNNARQSIPCNLWRFFGCICMSQTALGIQCGWYAIEDDGDLFSGPFSKKCVKRITLPTNETRASKLQQLPN